MTFEFFKRHNEPYLTDEVIRDLWEGDKPGYEPGFKNSPHGDDEETEEQAGYIALTAQFFAQVFPQFARKEGAAA